MGSFLLPVAGQIPEDEVIGFDIKAVFDIDVLRAASPEVVAAYEKKIAIKRSNPEELFSILNGNRAKIPRINSIEWKQIKNQAYEQSSITGDLDESEEDEEAVASS